MEWIFALLFIFLELTWGSPQDDPRVFAVISARDASEREALARLGMAIEDIQPISVEGVIHRQDLARLPKRFQLISARALTQKDFPVGDSRFHNYSEMEESLKDLVRRAPRLARLDEMGRSHKNRPIHVLTLGPLQNPQAPALFITGGHHAREHISVEAPLLLAERLVTQYLNGEPKIRRLLDSRMLYLAPLINPDGSEYDIESNGYRYWRKNLRENSGNSPGVDLNRNYDWAFATTGTSQSEHSETYCGPSAFSEPETRSVKDFFERHDNITTFLTLHSYAEMVLYPFGHDYVEIPDKADREAHIKIAQELGKLNGYEVMQSSDLYPASGDASDWAYAAHKVISFTFELDPRSHEEGGFYPGAALIDTVVDRNWTALIYLLEITPNPYDVLKPSFLFSDGLHSSPGK